MAQKLSPEQLAKIQRDAKKAGMSPKEYYDLLLQQQKERKEEEEKKQEEIRKAEEEKKQEEIKKAEEEKKQEEIRKIEKTTTQTIYNNYTVYSADPALPKSDFWAKVKLFVLGGLETITFLVLLRILVFIGEIIIEEGLATFLLPGASDITLICIFLLLFICLCEYMADSVRARQAEKISRNAFYHQMSVVNQKLDELINKK